MTVIDAAHGESPLARSLRRMRRSTLFGDPRVVIAGAMLLLAAVVALFAPLFMPYDPNRLGAEILQGPSFAHPMGTDPLGRDQLSRVIAGSRVSLGIALAVTTISLAIGVPLGLLIGYLRGRVDFIAGRALDVMFAFPGLILVLVLTAMFGPGLKTATIALCVIYIAPVTRFVRGLVIAERDRDYIVAARVAGATPVAIMVRHILPNVLSSLLVLASATMAVTVLVEAGLSFLGVGVQPPTPSWGRMLTENGGYLTTEPYLVVFPGFAIMYLVLALNLLGDGLRDYFDPRQGELGGARRTEPIWS